MEAALEKAVYHGNTLDDTWTHLEQVKAVLMKPEMTDDDIVLVKDFLYQDIEPTHARLKEQLKERLIMLVYMLDL